MKYVDGSNHNPPTDKPLSFALLSIFAGGVLEQVSPGAQLNNYRIAFLVGLYNSPDLR
jgi:hypothetical protein